MLPSVPTSNDLVFVPLRTDRPMETQLDAVDIILHKATDEIVSVTTIQTPNPAERIQYSDSIKTLQRYQFEDFQIVLSLSVALFRNSGEPMCLDRERTFTTFANVCEGQC